MDQSDIDQLIVFGVLACSLVLFVDGRIRYDGVALAALLAVTLTGIIDAEEAFLGFGHPAVVTVAAVLVLSRGLLNSGLVALISSWLSRVGDRPIAQLVALTLTVTVLSAFINNVGALALLMPVAIRMARSGNYPPSMLLMPLAFGSLLGGMMTLIGTPPNIIVATFRAEEAGDPFRMFDFAPVGAVVAIAGLAFMVSVGWRLVPRRQSSGEEGLFELQEYVAELRVPDEAKAIGMTVDEIEAAADPHVTVVSLVRSERRYPLPPGWYTLQADDVVIVEADPDELDELASSLDLEFAGRGGTSLEELGSDEVALIEAVVMPGSPLLGRSATNFRLRSRYSINLLAVSRRGARIHQRLNNVVLQAGDVLLLQGRAESMPDYLRFLGCIPLAERKPAASDRRKLPLALGVFAVAIGAAALGPVSAPVALVAAAVVMVVVGLLNLREAYEAVDWPIIVLLGAMIPVGTALEASGGADRIGSFILDAGGDSPPVVALIAVLLVTMFLSDIVNNAAAVVLMAPIALRLADGFNSSGDPFLMAVAVGASCAFLTPIGHQSNTLVMGPGGYQFHDYWRLGLPIQLIVLVVAVPMILLVWPL